MVITRAYYINVTTIRQDPRDNLMNVVTYIYSTASFGLNMRIEKVGGNRKGTTVSSQRQLLIAIIEYHVIRNSIILHFRCKRELSYPRTIANIKNTYNIKLKVIRDTLTDIQQCKEFMQV